jgi:hypothetical protein
MKRSTVPTLWFALSGEQPGRICAIGVYVREDASIGTVQQLDPVAC